MWVQIECPRSEVYETISTLIDVFPSASKDERRQVANALRRSARYAMAEYSRYKAAEVRRTGSSVALLQGLIPVAIAAGQTLNTPTGRFLLAMLLHSALSSGLDGRYLFAQAAEYAASTTVAEQLRAFPDLPAEERSIGRWGVRERKDRDGITYEHAADDYLRPRWWDKLLGRHRPTKEDLLNQLRSMEGGGQNDT